MAEWERTGVPIAEWGGAPGTVRVDIVLEDGTGRLLAAEVTKVNPSAPAPK